MVAERESEESHMWGGWRAARHGGRSASGHIAHLADGVERRIERRLDGSVDAVGWVGWGETINHDQRCRAGNWGAARRQRSRMAVWRAHPKTDGGRTHNISGSAVRGL